MYHSVSKVVLCPSRIILYLFCDILFTSYSFLHFFRYLQDNQYLVPVDHVCLRLKTVDIKADYLSKIHYMDKLVIADKRKRYSDARNAWISTPSGSLRVYERISLVDFPL